MAAWGVQPTTNQVYNCRRAHACMHHAGSVRVQRRVLHHSAQHTLSHPPACTPHATGTQRTRVARSISRFADAARDGHRGDGTETRRTRAVRGALGRKVSGLPVGALLVFAQPPLQHRGYQRPQTRLLDPELLRQVLQAQRCCTSRSPKPPGPGFSTLTPNPRYLGIMPHGWFDCAVPSASGAMIEVSRQSCYSH